MAAVKKAILRSFNDETYTATVEIAGSRLSYLENVPVARNLSPGEMINGRRLAVIFFDEHNARETVVAAVFT